MTSPAVVGSAWVVLRATSGKVKDDIKKAMQSAWTANERDALAAGRRAGQRYARGFRAGVESQGVDKSFREMLGDLERESGLAGARAGRRFAENYRREMQRASAEDRSGGSASGGTPDRSGGGGGTTDGGDRSSRDNSPRSSSAADDAANDLDAFRDAVRRANDAIDESNQEFDAFQDALRRANRSIENSNSNIDRMQGAVQRANQRRDSAASRAEEERGFRIRTSLDDRSSSVLRASLTAIAALLRSITLLSVGAMAALAGKAALAGLTGILGSLTQIAGVLLTLPSLAVAFAAPLATVAIGFSGITGAFEAMKQQTAGAAQTAKAVAAAQEGVVSAQERLEDANEGVTRSEKNAESAARSHARARERVSQAIEQVTERMQDLAIELKGTALDEEDALIAVARAEERLRNLPPGSSALDRREAISDYKKAQFRLEQVRESNEDVRTAAAKAAEEGVEGSEEVRDARQAEADAADAVAEANKAVADAHEQVAKAQQDVAKAIEAVAEASKGANADKLAEAMAKLAPAAQQFVYAMKELGPRWTEFRKSIQQNLFEGLGEAVTNLANVQLPILQNAFSQTATIVNGIFKDIMGAFSTPEALGQWSTILDRVNSALALARPGILAMIEGFKNLVFVGSEFFDRFARGFTENAQGFQSWTSNFEHIRNLIDQGISSTLLFWQLLKNLGGSLMAIMRAGADSGFTESFVRLTGDMRAFLEGVEGQSALKTFFDSGRMAMEAVGPPLKQIALTLLDVGGMLSSLGANIAPGVTNFFTGIRDALERIKPAIEVIGPKISNLFTQLGQVGPQLGATIAALVTHFSPWIDILSILSETLLPAFLWLLEKMSPVLAAMSPLIVGLALAWKAYHFWTNLVQIATKVWIGLQWALNAALNANPIGIIVIAIAALVAAFVLAYKNSETFRAFVDKLWASIKTGAMWVWENVLKPFFGWMIAQFKRVGEFFMWTWENLIKPAWDGLSTGIRWVWDNVLSPIFGWIIQNWQDVASVFMYAWENLIKPAWDMWTSALGYYWDNVISPIFGWIKDRWSDVAGAFKWAWENVISPSIEGWKLAFQWAWDNVLKPIFGYLKDRWSEVAAAFQWAWENVIKPAWDGLGDGIEWIWEKVIQPVWEGMKTGLDTLKGYFETVVKGIGTVWDGLREIVSRPVKFFVDTVFNGGIRKAWNAVANLIGADELPEMKLEGMKSGGTVDAKRFPFQDQTFGVMSGYAPGRDDRLIAVGGGESVLRPEATRALSPRWVNGVNAAARNGGVGGVRRWMRNAYADGGVVESMRRFVALNSPGMSLTSGLRFTDSGYHSKGMAADFSDTSANASTPGMQRLANIIANTFGPPKTLQLIHHPFNRNIGQGVGWVGDGMGFYGAGTMAEHQNHVHWAANGPVDEVQGDDKSVFGSIVDGIGNFFQKGAAAIFDGITKPVDIIMNGLSKALGGNESPFAQMPRGLWETLKRRAREFIVGKDGEAVGAGVGMPSPGSGPVMEQVKQAMMAYGWHEGTEWEALVKLVQGESSWNPTARNPSSGAYGLFQFLGSTKDAYLPDENPNPLIQGAAGARYIKDRYGSPSKAYDFWLSQNPHWYDKGGWLRRGLTLVNNETTGPEAVLTGQQWDWVKQGLNVDGANKWFGEQDFGSQFQQIGIDALKETLGGFTDLVGLTGPMEQLVDYAVERAMERQSGVPVPEENKLADTIIFNGVDPGKVQEELRRMVQQGMVPSNGRYRGSN